MNMYLFIFERKSIFKSVTYGFLNRWRHIRSTENNYY